MWALQVETTAPQNNNWKKWDIFMQYKYFDESKPLSENYWYNYNTMVECDTNTAYKCSIKKDTFSTGPEDLMNNSQGWENNYAANRDVAVFGTGAADYYYTEYKHETEVDKDRIEVGRRREFNPFLVSGKT